MQPDGAVGVSADQDAAAAARVVRCQSRDIASACRCADKPLLPSKAPPQTKAGRVQLPDGTVIVIGLHCNLLGAL